MAGARPFTIDISDETLSRIRERVAAYRWFPAPDVGGPWQFGMATDVMKDIQAYWLERYDWRAMEARLNAWPHFKAEVGGLDLHFLHIVGEAEGKRPLLLTHGWPGSFYEFYEAIGPLAYPSQHGGKAEDAFDLVIPSLPGYAFSGKPTAPLGQRKTAELFDALMRDVLGYETYLAQGGDWGGLVTSWLGFDQAAGHGGGCRAIHLNMIGFRPTPATPQSETEKQWMAQSQAAMQAEGAYFMQQATKPQTLAMALMDSPVGTAAWILEKFHGWSDLTDGDLFSVYSKDQLLTNVMLYLVNDAIATSVWYYAALFMEGGVALPEGQRVEVPTGFANYPGEEIYTPPPRSWCERAYNITWWSDMAKGGHFAAMEVPDLFVEDVRAWARSLD
ncbi:epoxide hydrolase family protein [Henriciella aquimarina]|uniref:epoxide hydrolase family protein n=1 Tax=Henriciella aquimarina TaxID=545261 RepID=UPI0009FBFDCB|nr:epoxide hydrolase family protein [Henriciella aquimarina]